MGWQADRERFAQMEAGESGRGAETVYRDKEGRRVEGPEALAAAAEAEKPKHEKPAWGGGIAQARLGTLLQQGRGVLHVCFAEEWWIWTRKVMPSGGADTHAEEARGAHLREACSTCCHTTFVWIVTL